MGGKFDDLTGKKYHRLTALEYSCNVKGLGSFWKCLCDCGNIAYVFASRLKTGNTKSCGCLNSESASQRISKLTTTHGESKTRLYRIWKGMIDRCKIGHSNAKNYGNRGIGVCEEWDKSFEVFRDWSMNNGYSKNLSIDRIDVSGNYEPNNCRWATRKQQGRNTRKTIYLTYNGETKPLKDWAEIIDVPYSCVYFRYQTGYSAEEILSTEKFRKNMFPSKEQRIAHKINRKVMKDEQ